jgi:hypothetical protein
VIKTLFIMLLIISLPSHGRILWQGLYVSAPKDAPPPQWDLEVLETGQSLTIAENTPFELALPLDTLWTICVNNETTSRCYGLNYQGSDSIFTQALNRTNLIWQQHPDTSDVDLETQASPVATVELPPETTDTEELVEVETTQLRTVVLRFRRSPQRSLGQNTVSSKDIKRQPSLAEADVIRAIQALPGVVASSDFSTKIYVRGGRSDQNLFLLDNAVVYSPVHFFGLFSTFLVENLDEVEFYKGGFPARYGNRLSSVLDIRSRKGGSDTTSWSTKSSVKISTFATQVHNEGHVGNFRWITSARSTYIKQVLDFLKSTGATDFSLDYWFYDLQSTLRYDFGPDHWINLGLYTGRDELDFSPIVLDWGNHVVPFNYKVPLNSDWDVLTSLSYSKFDQEFTLGEIISLYNIIRSMEASQLYTWKAIPNHTFDLGFAITHFDINFRQRLGIANFSVEDPTKFWVFSLFAQDRWQYKDWEFRPGVRLSHESSIRSTLVEPRLLSAWQITPNQSISMSLGYYQQLINSILFGDMESLNEFYYPVKKGKYQKVGASSSLLFSAGFAHKQIRGTPWFYEVEAYYKTLNNLPVFAPTAVPDSILADVESTLTDLFTSENGYSLGAEATMGRRQGAWTSSFSYSLGYTVMKDAYVQKAYYPDWHQLHSFKWDLQLQWKGPIDQSFRIHPKPGRYFRSALALKYASGLPYTPWAGYTPSHLQDQGLGISGGGPVQGFRNNLQSYQSERNSALRPPYFRLDLKLVDVGRENKWNFSWTILNITDNENIFQYFANEDTNPPTISSITQFPRFPLLVSYEYYF